MKKIRQSNELYKNIYENKDENSSNKSNNSYDFVRTNLNVKRKEKSLFIRKEIFDHTIIYTTSKLEEGSLLTYLRNFYEYFKKRKQNNNYEKNLNEEIYICLNDWLAYNELVNNQDNILFNVFSTNICKSLWILLSITLQCVRKKNNLNKQNTIFNTSFEELHIYKTNNKKKEKKCTDGEKKELLNKYDKYNIKDNEDKNIMDHNKMSNNENKKDIDSIKRNDNYFSVWNDGWLNENICIELVIFFIILQFLKIDNVKKKYDKSLSEDCWPNYMDSPRSVSNSSNSSLKNLNNLNNSLYRQNLSDFFNFCGKNYKNFLKTYLIAFLSSTDISNSTLSDMPLYFKNYHFFLLDFIIDTNDNKNVHEKFLLNNEYQILYKTKNILNWLLDSLCINESNYNVGMMNMCYSSDIYENDILNYGIEKINNDIYEIKNLQGKTLYINNDKNIVNIINCKECNIFIISTVEYLKINFCIDCYIICLSVEMITTLFNSSNIDIHLVTRCLKIENAVDTNIYAYTETNIIIFGDTRNIQLAPYNILNSNQKKCLEKSKIVFNEKNCELFAFPLKCKTNLCHSSLNLTNTLKTSNNNFMNTYDENKLLSREIITSNNNNYHLNDNKKLNISNKTHEHNNLASSFTDYVYYLLNPSNFFLVEFSDNDLYCKKKNMSDNLNESKCNSNENINYNFNECKNNSENNNLKYNFSNYVNKITNDKYVCLFLPEVYKNAIENQDEHILSFLNFMNSIKLTNSQKQKITKILTFKLYEYIRKSQKTFRLLNDFIRDQENANVYFNN
ncbi:conserved Plasmodium protein, unknown function [Plasmodium gallinaceum]|uniref:C-CAP/cofactor C-like domain-containing protein n=1 Tax=Plasmodium gallinaceum TaxID=5849 RepID=A0A1J1GUQ1_PLAGA|nr:conserved Plasmodium protein, unknown function [Plasmodium gallinaceum]CRG95971.1 conserved Plasmodium protein, unknown function [Plasmodium gallinaceum]